MAKGFRVVGVIVYGVIPLAGLGFRDCKLQGSRSQRSSQFCRVVYKLQSKLYYQGATIGVITGDTWSLDYSSYAHMYVYMNV